ncbi:MAG: hypothetical protein ABR518_02385 [Actinomycetota bacterium]
MPGPVEQLIDALAADPAKFRKFKSEHKKGFAAAKKWLRDNGLSSPPQNVADTLATLSPGELSAMKKGRDAATDFGVSGPMKAQMV